MSMPEHMRDVYKRQVQKKYVERERCRSVKFPYVFNAGFSVNNCLTVILIEMERYFYQF